MRPSDETPPRPASNRGTELAALDSTPTHATASAQILVTPATAAASLSISPRKLWELSAQGAIPRHIIGRSVRYSPAELGIWVQLGCPVHSSGARDVRALAVSQIKGQR